MGAHRVLPGHSGTRSGTPRQRLPSTVRPKRQSGTPHTAKAGLIITLFEQKSFFAFVWCIFLRFFARVHLSIASRGVLALPDRSRTLPKRSRDAPGRAPGRPGSALRAQSGQSGTAVRHFLQELLVLQCLLFILIQRFFLLIITKMHLIQQLLIQKMI